MICYGCNGSGEGLYEGLRCSICKGIGSTPDPNDWDGSDVSLDEDF